MVLFSQVVVVGPELIVLQLERCLRHHTVKRRCFIGDKCGAATYLLGLLTLAWRLKILLLIAWEIGRLFRLTRRQGKHVWLRHSGLVHAIGDKFRIQPLVFQEIMLLVEL